MKKFIKRILVGVVLPLTAVALFFTTWQVNQNTDAIATHQHSFDGHTHDHEHAQIEHTHEVSE